MRAASLGDVSLPVLFRFSVHANGAVFAEARFAVETAA